MGTSISAGIYPQKVKPFIKGLAHLDKKDTYEVQESIEEMIKAKQKYQTVGIESSTSSLDGFESQEGSIIANDDVINDDLSVNPQNLESSMLGNLNDMMNSSPKPHKTRIQRQFNELRGIPIASRSLEFQSNTSSKAKSETDIVTPYVLRAGFKMKKSTKF